MTTLTLTLDLADVSGIELAIRNLSLLLGKSPTAPAPAAASGQGTARTGAAPSPTVGAKSPAAPSAALASQASTAATGEAGNAAQAAGPAAGATAASSNTPAAPLAVTFDEVKKPFLGLSNTKGREACQAVLALFKLAKLSDAKPEQYAGLKAAIEQAAA